MMMALKVFLVSSLTVTWDAFAASYLGSQTARTETKAMMTQELVALRCSEYNR